MFDSLNHGLEEASGVFFVATCGCDEAEPGEHGNDHGHLDDDGVDVGVYAEDFEVFRYVGAAFLAWFGYESAKRVFTPHAVVVEEGTEDAQSLKAALLTTAAVTYLNPLAWLDTTIFLGSLANTQGDPGRWWYYLGCCCGSLIWFLMLGYGSRLLRPLFARPSAWRVLDGATALLMAYLVFNLLTMNLSTH